MHVAVAIVGFRNPRDVVGCLEALARSTHADFEVVVCENGGPDAYEALLTATLRVLPDGQPVRIVPAPRNLGYAGGVNLAMATAPDADAWWVLNPDTQAEHEALAELVARFKKGDCDAVGGVIYTSNDKIQAVGGRWQRVLARAVAIGQGAPLCERLDAAAIEVAQNYITGASALIGRRFFEAVGPMREDYFLYCEEVEWFLRGGEQGMRLGVAPRARVLHHAGSTTGSNREFREMPRTPVYLNERNRLLLTRDLWPWLLPTAAIGALLVIVARYARRGAWRQLGYAMAGWFAGLLGRRGAPPWISVEPWPSHATPPLSTGVN